jgi:hypothetical protein
MRTTDFDAIATAAPLNREASTVRDGSGDQWTPTIPATVLHWRDLPALRPPQSLSLQGRQALADMQGTRFGRLTVIGLLDKEHSSAPATWVCRCVCGAYEGRRMKALQSGKAVMCHECRAVEEIRATKTNTPAYRRQSEQLLSRLARRERSRSPDQ